VPGNVAGVLLAAGSGSRLGRPKALVTVGGRSLVSRGVALLQDGGADPVIVVTGAAELAELPGPGVVSVHNPDWATGMGSSLAAGLGAVPAGHSAAVVALADQVADSDASILITGESGVGKEDGQVRARPFAAFGASLRLGQLRRHPRGAARKRAVRPRKRRVHGRNRTKNGTLRAC